MTSILLKKYRYLQQIMKNDIQIKNKRAYFDYHILESIVAGLALL